MGGGTEGMMRAREEQRSDGQEDGRVDCGTGESDNGTEEVDEGAEGEPVSADSRVLDGELEPEGAVGALLEGQRRVETHGAEGGEQAKGATW